jgi:methyl-accepting chemotaxis protein
MLKREPTLLRWQADTLKEDIFNALDDRMQQADATVANVRAVVSEANGLVTSIGPTSKSLNEMLKTADTLFARFDTWDRWAIAEGSRTFDVREYTEGLKELAAAVEKMNDMLKSSNELLGSSEWDRRIQQVSQSADERIKIAAEQSQRVVHDAFLRVYVAIGILLAMFILCLVAVFLVIRRLSIVAGNASDAGRREMSK